MKIVELKCRFCGKVTGQFTLPSTLQDSEKIYTPEDLGVEDVRCDEHEAQYGNYNDMQVAVLSIRGAKHEDFLSIMKTTNYTNKNFEACLAALKERLDKEYEVPFVLELTGETVEEPTE